jgi:hypothetical protein
MQTSGAHADSLVAELVAVKTKAAAKRAAHCCLRLEEMVFPAFIRNGLPGAATPAIDLPSP